MKGQFKEVADKFNPKQNNYEMKYLKGVLCAHPKAKLSFTPFYHEHYGEVVDSYPFHTVMYQHTAFGSAIRNYLKVNNNHPGSNFSEIGSEWRESVFALADHYSE